MIKEYSMVELRLLKDLIGCPKGRIFKQDVNGDFFHSIPDEDMDKNLKPYFFTNKEVKNLPDWFEILTAEEIKSNELLKEIKTLTSMGVSFNFYNCDKSHLPHQFPYEAKGLEDVFIRIYKDSTHKEILLQIWEAKRNLIKLIQEYDEEDMSGYSELYMYLYNGLNFSKNDIEILKIK